MRAQRKAAGEIFDNPILVGTITILVAVVAVYLSYIAQNGLPFVPSYNVNVDVENAAQLVKNADVRVGGARVGQVLTITPEPADATWPHPFARLKLQLQKSLEPLPLDSYYLVRTASVLGGKYIELIPGNPKTGGLPDGGTFHLKVGVPLCSAPGVAPPNTTSGEPPNCSHGQSTVDLDTAFRTFGPKTARGLRNFLGEFGNAVAGRGAQFNNSIYSLHQLIGPLDNLLRLLASPSTHLAQFLSGTASFTGALAPVAPALSALLQDSATTFAAIENSGPALGSTIDQLPATETVGTVVLTNAQPVLADAASIVTDLKPAAALLPTAGQDLDKLITGATPVFKLVPKVAATLQAALNAVGVLAHDKATTEAFKVLGNNDLASFGASGFVGLGAILRAIAGPQFACNVAGVWARNLGSEASEGNAAGTWLRVIPILNIGQQVQSGTIAPDLHANPHPIEQGGQCQHGNEPYTNGQVIGNNFQTGAKSDNTTPPPGVLALGRKRGLVP